MSLREEFLKAVSKHEKKYAMAEAENHETVGLFMDKSRVMALVIDESQLPIYFKEPFKTMAKKKFKAKELMEMERFFFGDSIFDPKLIKIVCRVIGYNVELMIKDKDHPLLLRTKKGACVIAPRIEMDRL